MRALFRDRWDAPHGYRGGRPRPAPEPTPRERQIVLAMAASDCSQVAIADVLNVPRTRIGIWYRRMGLAPLSRLEGHMRGRSILAKAGQDGGSVTSVANAHGFETARSTVAICNVR
jgi:hypothetical protein